MKKLLAILLALLCLCACAVAEEAKEAAEAAETPEVTGAAETEATEEEEMAELDGLDAEEIIDRGIYLTSLTDDQGNDLYDVYMQDLPEGATLTFREELTENGVWQVHMDNIADIYVDVWECDLENAAGVSMAEISDEHLEQLKAVATIDYDDPVVEMQKTKAGNLYMHIYEKDESMRNICTFFTLYEGTIIQLVQYNDDFAPLTEEDHKMMENVLASIWVYPAE